ncbi:MAG TPA: hypothetical protein PKZ97_17215 [Azospirillaceae bacterium]|nr:hypothetical protein [Azospirillaceae bacterium]
MFAIESIRAARAQADHRNPKSYAARMRAHRAKRIRRLIDGTAARRGACDIVDPGGLASYWAAVGYDYLRTRKVHVTLINLRQVQTSLDLADLFPSVRDDAAAPPYPDRLWDLCHSNSVIEHIAGWKRKAAFARKVARLAPAHYIQTPNYWFPIEPHYLLPDLLPAVHWLPQPCRTWVLKRASLGGRYDETEVCELLTAAELRRLFPSSTLIPEHVGPFVKSWMVIGDDQQRQNAHVGEPP